MQRFVAITFSAILLGALPTGLATWAAYGEVEPNTEFDIPSLMHPDAPTSQAARMVYFNGFLAESLSSQNPNVATLQTRNYAAGSYTGYAILGVWTDCNGDGYVGSLETATREYPSELLGLLGQSNCPPANGNQNRWNGVSHNYNGWVSELIPIGNGDADLQNNTRQLKDKDVMVWADVGKPDEPSTSAGGGSCPISPLPRGTLATTAGLINYADCNTGLMALSNRAWVDEVTVGGQSVPGIGNPLGLRFNDSENAHGHAFWDRPLFGSEDSSRSAITVSDCGAPAFFDSGEFLNSTAPAASNSLTQNITVNQPAPGEGDLGSATVPGTVNRTFSDVGDCDPTDTEEGPFYGPVEGDSAPVRTEGKRSAADNFEYNSRTRGVVTLAKPGWNGYAGALLVGGRAFTNPTPEWDSNSILLGTTPNTIVTRGTITGLNLTAEIAPADYHTFYAYLPPALADSLDLPGGELRYGAGQCGADTVGVVNGWDCDPANWNLDTQGNPVSSTHPLAKVGDRYNLRDVDCYDGGNNLGIGVLPSFYGTQSCDLSRQ